MITIFANSTFYTPMPDEFTTSGVSTLDYMKETYKDVINGCWINGLTIMNVKRDLPHYLKERHRKNWVILNVGCVECYSHPAANILQWCCHYLSFYGCDPLFEAYVVPKMLIASKDLIGANKEFVVLLEPNEFATIFDSVLNLLEGFSVIVIGINKPKKTKEPHWLQQAESYKEVIEVFSKGYNNVSYIDSWNKYADYVVDTTHLTSEGHLKVFQELQSIIGGIK
jgi:hypothetical protein